MSASPTLIVVSHDQTWRYALNAQSIQIGRGSQNDITLLDDNVSRKHARLAVSNGLWSIQDLGSANGTRVNGRQIEDSESLKPGDRISIGDATLWIEQPGELNNDQETRLDDDNVDATAVGAETDTTPQTNEHRRNAPMEVVLPDTGVARVTVNFDGRTWEAPLGPAGLTIGRSPDNGIVIDHPRVSRRHARIEPLNGQARIFDEHSANGTYVGADKVTQHILTGGESVRVGPATLVFKPAFEADDLLAGARTSTHTGRKPIVFIPGFLGSQLWDGETLLWPNLRLLLSQSDRLKLPDTRPITARGLVENVVVVPGLFKLEQYSQLTEFLNESLGYQVGKDLLPFCYDWRKDLRIAAHKLKEEVTAFRASLPDPTSKVILIAHSMGCLVTRYFLDVLGGDQMAERVILMGGPQLGTPKIVISLLTGKVLPRGLLGGQIRNAISTFQGAYQLLPTYPTVFDRAGQPVDMFADSRWADQPFREFVRDAHAFRNELSPTARLPTLCIVGYGNATVTRAVVDIDDEGRWQHIEFIESDEGDSTIPVASAILEGADFHPVQQSHGALFVDNDVKFRLKLELTK